MAGVLDLFRLDGQAALVTGGSRGIGKGIALAIAEAGGDVAILARNEASLRAVAQEIETLGRRAVITIGDAGNPADIERAADDAIKALGHLSIWVNNAGGQPDMKQRPFIEVDHENFKAQIALNITSVWAGTVAAAKRLDVGGSIINISSLAAVRGAHSGHALYAAAKAAVSSLTGSLAHELGPRIRVNAVAPGPVLTETFYETTAMTAEQAQAALPTFSIPVGRFGTIDDIGAAIVFLASPAAGWISGETLFVTGGL
ncbi:MAG: benD [Sphingomonadales bacterium]|nr:benD [Sphingomonadales bacterium]